MNTDRQQHIGRLGDEEFDLVIVGGGITGACLAYDASRRGLRVALLEKRDFGSATSSASSKVLHGGIRFLQQARPDKVRESAFERIYFQNLVPHLCDSVPFMIPSYRGLGKGRGALFAASIAYYIATLGQNGQLRNSAPGVDPAYMINRAEVARRVPWLANGSDVTGALLLPEYHMRSSERVTWCFIHGAAFYGCAVANYVSAESLIEQGDRIVGVNARDSVDGTSFAVTGKIVANCSGPWMGSFTTRNSTGTSNPITAFSRGAHILLRGVKQNCAIALPTKQKIAGVAGRSGRHMFMIPWRGHTLVGTSYAPHAGSLDDVAPTQDDIEQLLTGINGAAGCKVIAQSDIVHAYAGIYPLIAESVRSSVYQGTGEYQVIDHRKRDTVDGFISVFGAKYTTARLLAEKACNLVISKLGHKYGNCATRHDPVPAAAFGDFGDYRENMQRKFSDTVDEQHVQRLVTMFGSNAGDVLKLARANPSLGRPLGNLRANLAAEAVYCARNEMLVHLDDFVFRRSGIGTLGNPGEDLLRNCVSVIGDELGWSSARRVSEFDRVADRFVV